MTDDVNGILADVNRALAELRETHDKIKAESASRGSSDALLGEKMAKLNAAIDAQEAKLKAAQDAAAAAAAGVDRLANRLDAALAAPKSGPTGDDARIKAAYETYLRKGAGALDVEMRKAMSIGDDASGGYLAPKEFVNEITRAVIEMSPMRSIVRVTTTNRTSVQVPRRTQLAAAVWIGEIEARPATAASQYGLDEIATGETYARPEVSEQLIEDNAYNIEGELSRDIGEAFGVLEGAAIVNGDGVKGKPFGFLRDSAVVTTASGAAAAITADGLIALYHDIKTEYARRGTFVLNRKTLGAIRVLKGSDNHYLFQAANAINVPSSIMGSPYLEVPDMPDIAAGTTPVAFGDFQRAYRLVDRVGMTVRRDESIGADRGLIVFHARKRLGGQVVLAEAIRKLVISA